MSSSETTFERLYVVDTHALIWYLINDQKLGKRAKEVFAAAERGETELVLSALVIAEMYYANKKHQWFADFNEIYRQLNTQAYFQFVDFRADHVLAFDREAQIPEMHDRIIAGLARRIGAPILTSDSQIKTAPNLSIVW